MFLCVVGSCTSPLQIMIRNIFISLLLLELPWFSLSLIKSNVPAFFTALPTIPNRSRIITPLFSDNFVLKDSDIIIQPSYSLGVTFVQLGGLLGYLTHSLYISIPIFLLSALLLVQTSRIRFCFTEDKLKVLKIKQDSTDLSEKNQNFFVGGKNEWKYSTFSDWRFIPFKELPILVAFTETQTNPNGQFHLFPVIMV